MSVLIWVAIVWGLITGVCLTAYGALCWLDHRDRSRFDRHTEQALAIARHPAGRVVGPEDDPAFVARMWGDH